jgi:hypothetical protein
MSQLTRDDFISLMIAELEGFSDLTVVPQLTAIDIFRKMEYDYPTISDEQILILTDSIISITNDIPFESFWISDKFLENLDYISTNPTYSQFQYVNYLCGSIYFAIANYMLKCTKYQLSKLFSSPLEYEELSWNRLITIFQGLCMTGTVSMLSAKGNVQTTNQSPPLVTYAISTISHLKRNSLLHYYDLFIGNNGNVFETTLIDIIMIQQYEQPCENSDSDSIENKVSKYIMKIVDNEQIDLSSVSPESIPEIIFHITYILRNLCSACPQHTVHVLAPLVTTLIEPVTSYSNIDNAIVESILNESKFINDKFHVLVFVTLSQLANAYLTDINKDSVLSTRDITQTSQSSNINYIRYASIIVCDMVLTYITLILDICDKNLNDYMKVWKLNNQNENSLVISRNTLVIKNIADIRNCEQIFDNLVDLTSLFLAVFTGISQRDWTKKFPYGISNIVNRINRPIDDLILGSRIMHCLQRISCTKAVNLTTSLDEEVTSSCVQSLIIIFTSNAKKRYYSICIDV